MPLHPVAESTWTVLGQAQSDATSPRAPFQSPTAADRGDADRLLELVETLRLRGGVSCAGSAPTDPGQALRLDARLTCAARAFADDLRVTRMQVLTDSLGRDTQARLALAGYEAQFWAEGLAIAAADPSDALSMMLSSPSACRGLTHPDARDVGVARIGDVFVVTLGTE